MPYGYYLSCGLNGMTSMATLFTVPTSSAGQDRLKRLIEDIDWVGVLIASACIAMLSDIFAMVTSSVKHLDNPTCAEHCSSISCRNDYVGFYLPSWTPGASERPAITSNSIWYNVEFACTCITVFTGQRLVLSATLPHFSSKASNASPQRKHRCDSYP